MMTPVTRHPSLVTRRVSRAALAAAALLLVSSDGFSQAYPAKAIRVINPVAPGGNQDTVARVYAEQLSRTFGQPVVVESRPGSSAVVGTRYVKSSPPDGYTLLAISNTWLVSSRECRSGNNVDTEPSVEPTSWPNERRSNGTTRMWWMRL